MHPCREVVEEKTVGKYLRRAIGGGLRDRAGSRRRRGPMGQGRRRFQAALEVARGRWDAWLAGGSSTPALQARRPRARPTVPFRRTGGGRCLRGRDGEAEARPRRKWCG
ncbi:Os01g0736450, partial [Oryza sativa Japonica Group]